MMTTYIDQAHKNNALRGLLGELQRKASDVDEHDSDAAREAYLDAAVSLKGILDKPVALADFGQDFPKPYTEGPDNTPDMAVTVAWPGDRGEMQSVSYGRSGGPDPDTLTALDRTIVRALLSHALETLDAMP